MAIARDATTAPVQRVPSGTSITVSHTCTGSNGFLSVMLNNTSNGTDVYSGVTYAGVSMTRPTNGFAGNNASSAIYVLGSPATGANNIVASFSNNYFQTLGAISYTGCNPTYDASGQNTAGPGAASVTTTIAPTVNDVWLVGCARADGASRTWSAGMTQQGAESGDQSSIADSNGTVASGSTTRTYNATSSSLQLVLVAIAPYVDAPRRFTLLGIGT